MSEPYISEVRMFSFDFPPKGWAACDGQLLPINQNQALFAILGTTFGGNGTTNFALPDLRGRTPIHPGTHAGGANHILGERAGEESHALGLAEVPTHTHVAQGTGATPGTTNPANNLLATLSAGRRPLTPYGAPTALTPLHPSSITNAGANQGHNNMQPFLTVNFCMALAGIFPSRN